MKNIKDVLAETKIDEAVGVKVVRISGDDGLSLLAAEVAPGKALRPHFHRKSIEIYYIEKGSGTARLGNLDERGGLEWEETFNVGPGDFFMIKPGQVHTLENAGPDSVIILVVCPISNITTDRQVC